MVVKMYYKHKKWQIFRKKLNINRYVLNHIYDCTLSLSDYVKYQLDGKVPISCIEKSDRLIVEKFGIDRCKELDWEFLDKKVYNWFYIDCRKLLLSIDSKTCDINVTLYNFFKDKLKPSDYSSNMKDFFEGRVFDVSGVKDKNVKLIMTQFNNGEVDLKKIVYHWDLFDDKDLSYCLLKDSRNKYHISDSDLKQFMNDYAMLVPYILEYRDIYVFIVEILSFTDEQERDSYMKHFTDELLANSAIFPSDNVYEEIFRYSSLEEYLENHFKVDPFFGIIEQLKSLPDGYIFHTSIPFSKILNQDVLSFLGEYGIENVVSFNDECGYFFTKDHCKNFKFMHNMTRYGYEVLDKNKSILMYNHGALPSKEEFYEIMRRIIVNGSQLGYWSFDDLNCEDITGEFRVRFPELFIKEDAPFKLQKLFYTHSITSKVLFKHPEYIDYLKGKDFSFCFEDREIKVSGTEKDNLYSFISSKVDFDDVIHFIMEYGDVLDILCDNDVLSEIYFEKEDDIAQIKDKIDEFFIQYSIENGFDFPKIIPDSIKNHFPVFASLDIQKKFYYHELTLEVFEKDSTLVEAFHQVNIIDGFPREFSWLVPLFSNLELDANVYRLRVLKMYDEIKDFTMSLGFQNYIVHHYKDINMDNLEKIIFIITNIKDYEEIQKFMEDIEDSTILYDYLIEIICYSYSWINDLMKVNHKVSSEDILHIISLYERIADFQLKDIFKDYVMSFGTDGNQLEYVYEFLLNFAFIDSMEMFSFRKKLATLLLKTDSPLKIFSKIKDIFIKNDIPSIWKLYFCLESLYPDSQSFDVHHSMISPMLTNIKLARRKMLVFSDLIMISFGSNSKSIYQYLKNIEMGTKLYEDIKSGKIKYELIEETEKSELIIFSRHLIALYHHIFHSKKKKEEYLASGDVLHDIDFLLKELFPDDTYHQLGNKIVKMLCGDVGINSLEQVRDYVEDKIKTADERNRLASSVDMVLEQGDFVKSINNINDLMDILQNGCSLEQSVGERFHSLGIDLSMVMSSEGTIKEKIKQSFASQYGTIWMVLKNDDRFIVTKTDSETLNTKKDMSKMEVFYTGIFGKDHYRLRTGFASSNINYLMVENYDFKIGLMVAIYSPCYIPIVDMDGKIVFTPDDYDELRKKMNGLSYYEMDEYVLEDDYFTPEVTNTIKNINSNATENKKKHSLIWNSIRDGVKKLNLTLKNSIDLTCESLILLPFGSMERNTNLSSDEDFHYIMQVDREIYESSQRMEELRNTIIKALSNEKEVDYSLVNGDIRGLKTVLIGKSKIEIPVVIHITFMTKTDQIIYTSDVCIMDRFNHMKNTKDRNVVRANIVLAKQLLKGIGVYSFYENMESIGIENWIFQNGGTLYNAMKSFMEVAGNCSSFEEFQKRYSLPDFGVNYTALQKGLCPHNNCIMNMDHINYEKMKEAFKICMQKYEIGVEKPVSETVRDFQKVSDATFIYRSQYDSEETLLKDLTQLLKVIYKKRSIKISEAHLGQSGKLYEFTIDKETYLVKPGVNKKDGKVNPASAEVQEVASQLQQIVLPNRYIEVKTYGSGNVRVAIQKKLGNIQAIDDENYFIKEHIKELLGEYVIDYLLANFDSNVSNFIIDGNGELRAIDKDQSFQYLLSDDYEESLKLDFSYSPEGSRKNIYPSLLQYIKENGLSDELSLILEGIKARINSISDEDYINIFKKYAYAYDVNKVDMILNRILERKHYFLNHIDELMDSICDKKINKTH